MKYSWGLLVIGAVSLSACSKMTSQRVKQDELPALVSASSPVGTGVAVPISEPLSFPIAVEPYSFPVVSPTLSGAVEIAPMPEAVLAERKLANTEVAVETVEPRHLVPPQVVAAKLSFYYYSNAVIMAAVKEKFGSSFEGFSKLYSELLAAGKDPAQDSKLKVVYHLAADINGSKVKLNFPLYRVFKGESVILQLKKDRYDPYWGLSYLGASKLSPAQFLERVASPKSDDKLLDIFSFSNAQLFAQSESELSYLGFVNHSFSQDIFSLSFVNGTYKLEMLAAKLPLLAKDLFGYRVGRVDAKIAEVFSGMFEKGDYIFYYLDKYNYVKRFYRLDPNKFVAKEIKVDNVNVYAEKLDRLGLLVSDVKYIPSKVRELVSEAAVSEAALANPDCLPGSNDCEVLGTQLQSAQRVKLDSTRTEPAQITIMSEEEIKQQAVQVK